MELPPEDFESETDGAVRFEKRLKTYIILDKFGGYLRPLCWQEIG
jgi:hypothetical protein